jgi:hypothetical protein
MQESRIVLIRIRINAPVVPLDTYYLTMLVFKKSKTVSVKSSLIVTLVLMDLIYKTTNVMQNKVIAYNKI